MRIRNATGGDLDALVRLNGQVQQQHAELHPKVFKYPTNTVEVRAYFESLIKNTSQTILVASNESSVFAYLYYETQRIPENTFKFAKERLYVHHVIVDAAARRAGTGSALFRELEECARRVGISEIALDTWRLNKGAHSFFERHGFQSTRLICSRNLS